MASITTKFRPSLQPDHEGTIYFRIIHNRKVRQLATDYHIMPDEWDDHRSKVRIPKSSERASLLAYLRDCVRCDLDRLYRIARRLDNNAVQYSADDLIDEFKRYTDKYSLFNFMNRIILKFKHNGRIRTSETYLAALKSFKKFHDGKDIMLDCISSDVMEDFEAWHRRRGNLSNTISFYTRILRAVYNRAVEEGVIENRNPFRHVYTGVDKTVKRAVPLANISKIKDLDLSRFSTLDYARDIFLMSFFLRGMSFIDMAFLRKSDLKNGYVIYRRRKTGQQLIIAWTAEMQAIIDKYPVNPTPYLLPIIRKNGLNEWAAYRNIGYNINHNLKEVGRMAGIEAPLTLYVARHSWASAARTKGIPLSIISEGMGHDNEATTRIYLASLSTSAVDRANALIIKSL